MTARPGHPPPIDGHLDQAAAPPAPHTVLDRVRAYAGPAHARLFERLPNREPYRYLYDLLPEYPRRGGKGVRAAICVAACGAVGGDPDDAVETATALELLHNAFLIHDDIEDESELRRGQPTLYRQFGAPVAINAGDALTIAGLQPLAANFRLLPAETAAAVLAEFIAMARVTTEGQALELGWRFENADALTDGDYLEMVTKKTAWYTTVCPIRTGILIGGRSRIDPDPAVRFATLLGVIFQIRDDLDNLEGGLFNDGKERFGDILEGKRTLVIIHLLRRLRGRRRDALLEFLARPRGERDSAGVLRVYRAMDEHGALAHTHETLGRLTDAAHREFERAFASFAPSPHRDLLHDLIDVFGQPPGPVPAPLRDEAECAPPDPNPPVPTRGWSHTDGSA